LTGYQKAQWLLEMLFPYIGKRPIREVTPPELLSALRKIESRGHLETAHRCIAHTFELVISASRKQA
jgi:hypothetical protein